MTDAELAAELREQAEMNELEFERVTLRLAADRLEALAAERDAAERGEAEMAADRDRYEEALSAAHRALGGDGEWVARLPAQPPPDSGDLVADVPELARRLLAERDAAVARVAALEAALKPFAESGRLAAEDDEPADYFVSLGLWKCPTVGDCIRAAELLAGEGGGR